MNAACRRLGLLGVALALVAPMLAVLATISPADAAVTAKRATWVWTRPPAKTLVRWATQQKVAELFVYVGPGLASSPDLTWVRSVVTQAHDAGIKVAALGGEPSWVDNPSAALAWQRSALSTGLFDGVHVDIEPWTRSDWSTAQPRVVAGYLDVLSQLAADTTLPLEADIAFWLWQVPTASGEPLDQAVMRTVEAVTVMSYRNKATGPDSITDIGAHELATAAAAGIPCRLAVETNYLGGDPVSTKQTFYGLGARALAKALATVDSTEAGVASYAGIAIHDYDGWRAL